MRGWRMIIIFLVFLVCLSLPVQLTAALSSQAPVAGGPTKPPAAEGRMIEPSDLFRDFPGIGWAMSFREIKQAIEKTGADPVGFKNYETELAWDGTFNGMSGRGTVLFREDGGGVYEIAVIVYAMGKRKEVFEQVLKKIVEKHGAANDGEDTSIATSKVWRLKNGFTIEVRLLKDVNSPVVDVHWVKG